MVTARLAVPPRLELTVTVPGLVWPMAANVYVPSPLLVITPKPSRVRMAAWVGSFEVAATVRVERRRPKVAVVTATGSPAGSTVALTVAVGVSPLLSVTGSAGLSGADGRPLRMG